MDPYDNPWYFSGMAAPSDIPTFNLFGETVAFPDVVHYERIRDRARHHDWIIAPHRHSHMVQVLHVAAGGVHARIDAEAAFRTDGAILYVPAHTVHGFRFDQGTQGDVLSFPLPVVTALRALSPGLGQRLERPMAGLAKPRIRMLIGQFAASYQDRGSHRAEILVALAHAILASIAEVAPGGEARLPAQGQDTMARLDALIAAHGSEGLSPRDYAARLSITTGHLTRLCRAAAGCTASNYIEAAVMAEACRLLAFTRLSVGEVGYRTGFSDPSYFSRRFRRIRGEAPTDYRARFTCEG